MPAAVVFGTRNLNGLPRRTLHKRLRPAQKRRVDAPSWHKAVRLRPFATVDYASSCTAEDRDASVGRPS